MSIKVDLAVSEDYFLRIFTRLVKNPFVNRNEPISSFRARFCRHFHVGMVSQKLPEKLPIEKTTKKKSEFLFCFFLYYFAKLFCVCPLYSASVALIVRKK
jgi:hypothetical protein